MATQLTEFFLRYTERPFVWGEDDCSLFIADWWKEVHGTDPATHLRGTYSTEAEKADIVKNSGGLVNLVSIIAASVGAEPCEGIDDGNIAVVRDPRVGYVSAIRSGNFWAVRSQTGIAFTSNVKILAAWRV